MGNWHISIRGVGPHHNGKPEDADQVARRVTAELKAAGHTISDAAFTYGAHADVGAEAPAPAPLPEPLPEAAAVSPAAQPMP